jgi:hypothetical protein
VLPTEGTASFALTASDATLQVGAQIAVAASVKDAHLSIDFANRRFETGMTVYNSTTSIAMKGQGDISLQGALNSDYSSLSNVRGYLGGAAAGEAGYVFKTLNPGTVTAEGATSWKR